MPAFLRMIGLFALLMLIFMAFGAVIGSYFGGSPTSSMMIFLVLAGVLNFVSYFFSDKIVLRAYRAKIVSEQEQPQLHAIVGEVAHAAGLPKPKVAIVPSDNPNAFATGRNPNNAVVAVTRGILQILNPDELKGVLAHEMAHVKNRDILIMSVAATIVGAITFSTRMIWFSMIFGGRRNVNPLVLLAAAIPAVIGALLVRSAISRSREYKADKSGARFIHNPETLARALEKLEYGNQRIPMKLGSPASSSLFIVNPFRTDFVSRIMSTHPPMEKRIKALREMRDY